MIVTLLSVILCIIFMFLGGLHLYWLLGGVWGLDKVIPSKEKEPNSLSIPPIATLMVALVLISFGGMYFIKSDLVLVYLPGWITSYAYWIIPSIFFLRAIGEFNYVGFFKKVKHTKFAQADSQIFSPLCLGIAIMGFLVQLVN